MKSEKTHDQQTHRKDKCWRMLFRQQPKWRRKGGRKRDEMGNRVSISRCQVCKIDRLWERGPSQRTGASGILTQGLAAWKEWQLRNVKPGVWPSGPRTLPHNTLGRAAPQQQFLEHGTKLNDWNRSRWQFPNIIEVQKSIKTFLQCFLCPALC